MLEQDIKTTLKKIYATETKIERFNGKKIDAKEAYINLAIVERQKVFQDNKNIKGKKKKTNSFEQMYSKRRAIDLNELFAKEVSFDKPHRVLIKGAAGIGKTSLCKHLCRQYSLSCDELNISNIPFVFWLPFRGIKGCNGTSKEEVIAKVIYNYYFENTKLPKDKTIETLTKILQQSSKVLLILDGFDEIAAGFYKKYDNRESSATPTYRALLKYPHVMVVTRPNYLDRLPDENRVLELENIGFTRENIINYVNKFYKDKKLEQFIVSNEKVLAMAHIPINVDLICNAYTNNKNKDLDLISNSMTRLYTTVVEDILNARCKKLKIDGDSNQKAAFMDYMRDFFGLLSFKKMQATGEDAYTIKFNDISKVIKICNENAKKSWDKDTIKFLAKDVTNVGFFVKVDKKNKVKSRQFLHLTFQEYFAAKYLADALKGKGSNYKDAVSFIDKNKYEERYQILWWFISGILSKGPPKPLYVFLNMFLNSKPDYKKEIYKDALHLRILDEGPVTEGLSNDYKTKKLINRGITVTNNNIFKKIKTHSPNELFTIYTSIASSQKLFYSYGLMKKLLTGTNAPVTGLGYYFTKQSTIDTLQKKMIVSLGLIGLNHKDIRNSLARFTRDKKLQAVTAQSQIQLGNSSPKIVKILIKTAHQDDFLVDYLGNNKWGSSEAKSHLGFCNALRQILIQQSKLEPGKPDFINNLFKILELIYDDKLAEVLRGIKTSNKLVEFKQSLLLVKYKTDTAFFNIKKLLFLAAILAKNKDLKSTVIHDMQSLLSSLKNRGNWFAILKDWQTQLTPKELSHYLNNITTLFVDSRVVAALIKALGDKDSDVRANAARALGNIGKLGNSSELVIAALIKALGDYESDVRANAAKALGNIGKLGKSSELVVAALIKALGDSKSFVRANAATALGNIGKLGNSSELVIAALIKVLRDKDSRLRAYAAEALGKISKLGKSSELVIAALIKALGDYDSFVRADAAEALGKISKLGKSSELVIAALIKALGDKDSRVRANAVTALGNIGKLGNSSKLVIAALIKALGDKDSFVRANAATSLGNIGKLGNSSELVIAALIKALGDKYSWRVRANAAEVLGNIGKFGKSSELVIAALIKALGDKDSDVRANAAEALGNIGKLGNSSELVIAALLKALGDKDSRLRAYAAEALGKISKLGNSSELVIAALIKALGDSKSFVRANAAEALGNIGNLGNSSELVITSLIKVLRDKDSRLRANAAEALGNIGKLGNSSELVIAALIKALGDKDSDVRANAVTALGKISKLGKSSELVIAALLKALGDKDSWKARANAVTALGNIGKLGNSSKLVIAALIKALGDKDSWKARANAATSLGNIGNLGNSSELVIAALIKALGDKDSNVRDSATTALGNIGKFGNSSELVIAALIKALGDKYSWLVRAYAARALGSIVKLGKSSELVIAALLKALVDYDSFVRANAAEALGNIAKLGKSSELVIAALIKALGDKDSWVMANAAEALEDISRLDKGNSDKILLAIKKALKPGSSTFALSGGIAAINKILKFDNSLPWLLTPGNNPTANVENLLYIAAKVYESGANEKYQKGDNKNNITTISDYLEGAKYSSGEIVEIKDASFNFDNAKIIVAAITDKKGKFKPVTINITGNIESNSLDKLLTLLSLDMSLEGLKIRVNFAKLKTYDYSKITTKLKSAKYPERLYISSNDIDMLETLAKNNKNLILPVTELDASNSNKINSLLSLKDRLPYLVDLKLNNNKLDLKNAKEIVKSFPRVKNLDLKSNYINLSKRGLKKLTHRGMNNIYLGQNYIKNPSKIFTKEANGFYHYNIFKTKLRAVPSRLNPKVNISRDKWICALVCKKNLSQSRVYAGHSMIFMEGMGSYGQRFLRRFHIEGVKLKDERVARLAKVDEAIDISKYSLENYHINAKAISPSQGKLLQKKVEADFGKKLPFDMYFAEAKGKNKLNCLKWCKEKFTQSNIRVNTNNRWVPIKAARDKKFFK